MYIAGYPVDDPSVCVKKGQTVINPELHCSFRKLITRPDVIGLCAGLNYLAVNLNGDSAGSYDLLVWGQSPCDTPGSPRKKKVSITNEYGCRLMSFERLPWSVVGVTAGQGFIVHYSRDVTN